MLLNLIILFNIVKINQFVDKKSILYYNNLNESIIKII